MTKLNGNHVFRWMILTTPPTKHLGLLEWGFRLRWFGVVGFGVGLPGLALPLDSPPAGGTIINSGLAGMF